MNRPTKLALSLLLVSGIVFQAQADSEADRETVALLLGQYDVSTLVLISNEMIQTAMEEEQSGDWDLAASHLTQARLLREALGDRQSKSHASLLLLQSSVSSKVGKTCEAEHYAKQAQDEFHVLGLGHLEEIVSRELILLSKYCQNLVSE